MNPDARCLTPSIFKRKVTCNLVFCLGFIFAFLGKTQEIPITYPGDVDHLAFRAVERRENDWLVLMLREGLSPNLRASDGTTLLMYAALHGDAEGVHILLEAGADPNLANDYGACALIWGAADVDKVRYLILKGAEVNVQSRPSRPSATPLSAASSHTDGADSVAFLLKAGADDSIKARDGLPFELAAKHGCLESVKIFLNYYKRNGRSDLPLRQALANAIGYGHSDVASYILNWDGSENLDEETLNQGLSEAIWYPLPSLAQDLINRGAKVSDLIGAAFSDVEWDTNLLKTLIDRGVDLNKTAYFGLNALDLLNLRGFKKSGQLLLNEGLEPSLTPKKRLIPDNSVQLTDENRSGIVKTAVSKSLDLLFQSSDLFLKNKKNCTSCHHQDLPAIAASIASTRGVEVQHASWDRIVARQWKRHRRGQSANAYDRSRGFSGDPSKATGYLLWAWSAQGLPANSVTKAGVWYLAGSQLPDGQWHGHSPRMPIQDGAHQGTALSLRALKSYPLPGREEEMLERIDRARLWLEKHPGDIHTHSAFRLLGLAWAEAEPNVLEEGMLDLTETQNADGGWSQLETLPSDAWATGLALLALQAAGMNVDSDVYTQGVQFLLNTQFEDGSWFVYSRSDPSIPHFDSQFPFGRHQWISAAGTAMAAASLALSLDPVVDQRIRDSQTVETINSNYLMNQRSTESGNGLLFEFDGTRTVDFEQDIRPLLETSCLDCHDTQMNKGEFKMTDRNSIIIGGRSGRAAIELGQGAKSLLVRHVTDQIEDMEMPPLVKRKNYPKLTPDQVQKLITWIDEGAEWPEGITLE